MKLAIMQPYFMPYLGYFQCMAAVDTYLLYDRVSYIKKGWINRNRINVINIGPAYITIPLTNKSSDIDIKDVLIDNSQNWRKKILDLIYYNYKNSMYFDSIYPLVQDCINFNCDKISEYNYYSLSKILKFLDVNTQLELSTDSKFDTLENNLKSYEDSNKRKHDRVVNICNLYNADIYINAWGG